jgi:hypothetical protein
MFEFTIKDKDILNDFLKKFSDFVNRSYKFTMTYLSNPMLADFRENERLILISVNKSVYQNMYSFLRLNDSHMQYAAFACLENALYAMRFYRALALYPDNMHTYITSPGFVLEESEKAEEKEQERQDYRQNEEEFSVKEFYFGLHKVNTFELKNSSISTQIIDQNVYLGLSCGKELSGELQNEVRKNLIGAYLSLSKHTKMFFNGGLDEELEKVEDEVNAVFFEYIKKFS